MEYRTGPEFSMAEVREVREFLKNRHIQKYVIPPERLHVVNDGTEHFLRISNGKTGEYPVRGSFLFKLLKWYRFPARQVDRLSIDTVSSVLNDYLLAIPGGEVNITLEDGEAVSITSKRYNELSDIEVLDCAEKAGVACVSRNDYFMRVYTDTKYEVEPVPGDVCGIGCNVLNSETGFQALSVYMFIRRYVCSNGAVVRLTAADERRVHYGHPDMELKSFLEAQLRAGELLREEAGKCIEKSTRIPLQTVVNGVLEQLRPLIGRRKSEEIVESLREDATVYDLANSITSFAQSLDLKRRLQAESIGGELLVPRTELPITGEVEFEHQLIGA
jgi:hypothetical protein